MWLPTPAATALGFASNVAVADRASAPVKWFCAFDVAGQPRGLSNVLCPDFELLVGIAILTLIAGCLIEGSPLGDGLLRSLDRATKLVRENTETLFRAGCAFFFIAVWATGGILLTPELKTNSTAVGILQLGIAAGMLSRKTMPLSAAGIAILFALAVYRYGAFHLADYPVFLGVAAYLALIGLQRDLFGVRPIDVVRYAAAVTLMWASVEKWAYPQWTFPLLIDRPGMTLAKIPNSSCAPRGSSNSRWRLRCSGRRWSGAARRSSWRLCSSVRFSSSARLTQSATRPSLSCCSPWRPTTLQ
jgi:hypothetical protein